jgi:hypothetical protein
MAQQLSFCTDYVGTHTNYGGAHTNYGGTHTNYGGTHTNYVGTHTNYGGAHKLCWYTHKLWWCTHTHTNFLFAPVCQDLILYPPAHVGCPGCHVVARFAYFTAY